MKNLIKKIILGYKYNSDSFVKYLKHQGCKIGGGTTIYSPSHTLIDLTRPWLIEIGENVQITNGVTILTHGYDWSVLKGKYGEILGSSGKVKIGNNVFIGMNSTILKGVTIGDNVIIGANSLVNKNVPDNVVVAGNPAKTIMSIDDYLEKRRMAQLHEAVELTLEYYKQYKVWPSKKILREYIWLFEDRNSNIDENEVFIEIGNLLGNYEETKKQFYKFKGKFNSYDEFIRYCEQCIK